MDKNFCRQIDHESLVEQYVSGKLRGELLVQFEQHLKDCEEHARAVLLEKALKRGVSEFARGEIKTKLRSRLKKREDTRFMMLRYAAILFVAVITPLLLYYQLNVAPEEMSASISEKKEEIMTEDAIDRPEEELQKGEEPPKVEIKTRRSRTPVSEEKPASPAIEGAAADQLPARSPAITKNAEPLEASEYKKARSAEMQDMVKAVKPMPSTKIEADYPEEDEILTVKDDAPAMATQGYSQGGKSHALINDLTIRVDEDSLLIRECIDSFLSEADRHDYQIEISIQILNDGKIGETKVTKTTYQSSELEMCLLDIIKAWKLSDGFEAGTVVQKITY